MDLLKTFAPGAVLAWLTMILTAGLLEGGERAERAALWSAAAADVAATKYAQVRCEHDPYCHGIIEHGWLGRMVVGDSATNWKPVLVKAGMTFLIDRTAHELGRDGDRLEDRAYALAVTATTEADWTGVLKLRREARSARAWRKRIRLGGAIFWTAAAGWATWGAR